MGQYYTPIIMKGMEYICFKPQDYDSWFKLTEHAYQNNHLVNAVVIFLTNNPSRLAWVGEYAESCDMPEKEGRIDDFIELNEHPNYKSNLTCKTPEANIYINHSQKKYFILAEKHKEDELVLHPLPLLTALGNGKSESDYYGTCMELVGTWATDMIEVKNNLSDDLLKNYEDISSMLKFEER